ncbi:MAG: ABC transporter ATP-binding protein [Desulfobulbaceae bacterium]|nr:ABC transporter ATP-binding protein [Desulfobulbaceae bacterium]
MSNNTIISLNNVQKTYRNELKRRKIPALQDLTFSVGKGEVFGIIGPNGAGKSTALKILMGFISYDHGKVLLAGKEPGNRQQHDSIGFLPENPCLYKNLTVTDHLQFAASILKIPATLAKQKIKALLAQVQLEEAASIPIRRFSKGMSQRAALAYALLPEPELLILDEPMSGLDPLGRELVINIIRDYNRKGNTILFCSHILTDVERICDRIAIINKGKIAATTTPAELKSHTVTSGASPLESLFLQTVKDPEKCMRS